MPGAYEIAGRYRVNDGAVKVTVMLFRGEEEVATFSVEGQASDSEAIAARIVDRALDRIPR